MVKISPFSTQNNPTVNSVQNTKTDRIFSATDSTTTFSSTENINFDDAAALQKIKNFDRTILIAKNAILNDIESFGLEEDDKNMLQNGLNNLDAKNIPKEIKTKSVSLSEAAFMLISKTTQNPYLAISLCSKLINNDTRFKDFIIEDSNAPRSIQGKSIVEFGTDINNNSAEKIEKIYKNAQKELIKNLTSNPNKTFENPYNQSTKISASDLIQYVQNLNFRNDKYGAAQASDFTPNDGINERNGILVNSNIYCQNPYMSEAEAMKILIHEALHCAYSKEHFPFNNQKEEMYCERQAIMFTSEILQNSDCNIKDTESGYGKTYAEFSQMSENELTEFLDQEFISKGYEHRPKDLDGNVNIMGYELQSGDEIIIDGQKMGNIGRNGNILDQLDEHKILLFGCGGGQVIFSKDKPDGAKTLTIERNGQKIMTAFVIPFTTSL